MDGELILPEVEAKDFVAPAPAKKSLKISPFVILAIAGFFVLAGALVFILINHTSGSGDIVDEPAPEQLTYDAEAFSLALSQAEERLEIKDYVAVDYYTKNFSSPERMTSAQKYRYFSLLASLYSESHLNDSARAAQYAALADDALKSIRKGE